MNAVICGGTSGMGRALARLLAERKSKIALMERPGDELERSARDLEQRGAAGPVATIACDLADPSGFEAAFAATEAALGGKIDLVVLTAAMFGTQDQLEADTDLALKLCTLNFANSLAWCEYARKRLLAGGGGTLCVFSSVAGDRGRKPVGIYGAGKAGLSHYLESLDHKYRSAGLITVTVKPGFVKTAMTAGLKPPPFAGEPEGVARRVLWAIDRKKPVVYAPWIWRWILLVIRMLPRFAMRRIGF
jgi:short-subunit dehydrogenase